ncbi:MAG: WD40 repeat domain-containing serine/threonine-protein kinase [Planctomycetota bacterium]
MTETDPEPRPGDDLSDAELERALLLDRIGQEFGEALESDPRLSAEDFAARHDEVDPEDLVPVLRAIEMLARTRRTKEGPFGPGDAVGPYRIRGELGRGGMGIVYEAVEEGLGRAVAIKALHAAGLDERFRSRFDREARAAARLDHPGIVPVFGSGESDGVLWFAMRRVDGVDLERCLEDLSAEAPERLRSAALARLEGTLASGSRDRATLVSGIPRRARAAAAIVMRLADALAYAHSEGVLHRDVKPGNVMLDRDGTPLLTDFGLCKVEGDASLTAATDIVGTLRYMPPEALDGKTDARGDVYGLGLVLYELVTGKAAFEADDRRSMLHRILHVDPVPLRRVMPGVPVDLERITAKAIAKLPEERYATAADLAEDLAALLAGQPVQARAPSALYLLQLFVRRNRAVAATLVAATVLIAVGAVQYVAGLRAAFADASAARDLAEDRAAQANVATAEAALRTSDTAGARAAVEAVDEKHRGWMWRYVARRVGLDADVAPTRVRDITSIAVAHDGPRVALCGRDAIDLCGEGGREVEERLEVGALEAAFLDGDASLVFLQRNPRALVRWDIDADEPPRTLATLDNSAARLFQLGSEPFALVLDGYKRIEAWDLEKGERIWWRNLGVPRISVAAPLTRTRFVFGTTGGNLYVVDTIDDSVTELEGHNGYVRTLLVEDGELLASGSDEGRVKLWPAYTGTIRGHVDVEGGALAFARPPGRPELLAVATGANTVALIHVPTCVVRRSLAGPTTRAVGLQFGSERWLSVFLNGSEAVSFDRDDHDGRIDLPPAIGNFYPPDTSDDGRWIVVNSNSEILHVYDLEEGEVDCYPHDAVGRWTRPAIDPEGEFVAYGGLVRRLQDGARLFEMDSSEVFTHDSVVLSDRSVVLVGIDLATRDEDGPSLCAWRWRSASGEAERVGVLQPDLSPSVRDRRVLALADEVDDAMFVAISDHSISRYDLAPLEERWRLSFDGGRIMALVHEPGADRVYFVADDGLVHVVDAETGEELEDLAWRAGPRFSRRAALNSIALGPEPGLVTTSTVDCRVEVWEAATGRRVGSLTSSPDSYIRHVAALGDTGWIVGSGGFGRLVLFGSGPDPAPGLAGSAGLDVGSALERVQDWLFEPDRPSWAPRSAQRVLAAIARSARFRSTPWLEEQRAEIQAMIGD